MKRILLLLSFLLSFGALHSQQTDKNTIKSWFLTGLRPTQTQFHSLIDNSYNEVTSGVLSATGYPTISFQPWNSAGNGRLYFGTSNPTGTLRLNYDGYLYATKLYAGGIEINGQSIPTTNNPINIYTSGLQNGDFISYNTLTSRFENLSITATRDIFFPAQGGGNAGRMLKTDGTSVYWALDNWLNDSVRYYTRSFVRKVVNDTSLSIRNWANSRFQPILVSGTNLKSVNGSSLLGSGDLTISAGLPSDSLNFSSDLLYWDRPNRTYKSYTSKPVGVGFYTGTTNPDGTTRLNLNAALHATLSIFNQNQGTTTGLYTHGGSGGRAIIASSSKGALADFIQYDDPGANISSASISIQRSFNGNYNYTGDLLSLLDNPTTSGTISGKVFTATIGTTERISMYPRVPDGSSAVAYMFDTHNALANATSKLLQLNNQGIEKFYVGFNGNIFGNALRFGTGSTNYMDFTLSKLNIVYGSVQLTELNPRVSNSTNVEAYNFNTELNLTASGAKLASFKNAGTEKLYISHNGTLRSSYDLEAESAVRVLNGATNYNMMSYDFSRLAVGGTIRMNLVPTVADASNALAYLFDTNNSLTNATAYHSIWKNQGVELARLYNTSIFEVGSVRSLDQTSAIINGTNSISFNTSGSQKMLVGSSTVRIGSSTNNSTFEADGTLVYNGTATVWEDVNVAGVELGAGAADPDLISVNGTTLFARSFDGNATLEELFGTIELPHSYKEGSDITIHIHWMPTTTGSGNVKWNVDYQWVNAGDVFGSSVTTVSSTVAASGTAWDGTNTDIATLTGTGKTISSHIMFRLYRNPADVADTYAADATLIQFGIHYEKDTNGSRTITTK